LPHNSRFPRALLMRMLTPLLPRWNSRSDTRERTPLGCVISSSIALPPDPKHAAQELAASKIAIPLAPLGSLECAHSPDQPKVGWFRHVR
jgi:hypothetical protein